MGVRIAYRFRCGRNGGDATAGLATHFRDQARAASTMVLMVVVHRGNIGREVRVDAL
jgi:hypothetical protein